MIKPNTRLELDDMYRMVVAVIGYNKDFAVYESCVLNDTAENVVRFGDKLSEDEARDLFPELSEYWYRQ